MKAFESIRNRFLNRQIAVAVIATGDYVNFLPDLLLSCERHLAPAIRKHYLLFTDRDVSLNLTHGTFSVHAIENKPWPYVTLMRFHTILGHRHLIRRHRWFLYLDADMKIVDDIQLADIFDKYKPLTAVHHPAMHNSWNGTFERNPQSTACVFGQHKEYFQGCLWGGEVEAVVAMMETLKERIDVDLSNEIVAIWHDESHLNKYLLEEGVPLKMLGPNYACPENDQRYLASAKIIHVFKDEGQFVTFPGHSPPSSPSST